MSVVETRVELSLEKQNFFLELGAGRQLLAHEPSEGLKRMFLRRLAGLIQVPRITLFHLLIECLLIEVT